MWIKLFAHSQCAIIENITYQSGNVNNRNFSGLFKQEVEFVISLVAV